MAADKSNHEIANALYISLNTFAMHACNILTKIGTANRIEAAARIRRKAAQCEV